MLWWTWNKAFSHHQKGEGADAGKTSKGIPNDLWQVHNRHPKHETHAGAIRWSARRRYGAWYSLTDSRWWEERFCRSINGAVERYRFAESGLEYSYEGECDNSQRVRRRWRRNSQRVRWIKDVELEKTSGRGEQNGWVDGWSVRKSVDKLCQYKSAGYGADYGTGIPENGGKDYQFARSFAPGISTVIELESASWPEKQPDTEQEAWVRKARIWKVGILIVLLTLL